MNFTHIMENNPSKLVRASLIVTSGSLSEIESAKIIDYYNDTDFDQIISYTSDPDSLKRSMSFCLMKQIFSKPRFIRNIAMARDL